VGVTARRYLTAQESLANFHSPEEGRIGAVREGVAAVLSVMDLEPPPVGIEEFANEGGSELDKQRSLFKFSPSLTSMIGHRFA